MDDLEKAEFDKGKKEVLDLLMALARLNHDDISADELRDNVEQKAEWLEWVINNKTRASGQLGNLGSDESMIARRGRLVANAVDTVVDSMPLTKLMPDVAQTFKLIMVFSYGILAERDGWLLPPVEDKGDARTTG